MYRREFIKAATLAGLSLSVLGCMNQSHDSTTSKRPETAVAPPSMEYDLTIVQGTEPVELLERGFKAIGGIERYVQKGNSVVIKPNFSVPRTPEEAATTNTTLVATLVKMCLAAGAREVKVVDYPLNGSASTLCLEKTGIKAAVEAAGGKAFTYNGARELFQPVTYAGKVLTSFEFSKDVLDADVFINFSILKHHRAAKVTLGMKNMMGLVWDRGFFHRSDLHQAIADLAGFRKPTITILDAIRGITDNGPVGPGPIKEYGQLVFGTDQVAIDAYGAALFGLKPEDVGYIQCAYQSGLGQIQWEKLKLQKV